MALAYHRPCARYISMIERIKYRSADATRLMEFSNLFYFESLFLETTLNSRLKCPIREPIKIVRYVLAKLSFKLVNRVTVPGKILMRIERKYKIVKSIIFIEN